LGLSFGLEGGTGMCAKKRKARRIKKGSRKEGAPGVEEEVMGRWGIRLSTRPGVAPAHDDHMVNHLLGKKRATGAQVRFRPYFDVGDNI